MSEKKVLFLCTGNVARSQMAEAFLRKYAGGRFHVQSAGLVPGPEIHPLTRRVMSEVGLDLAGQYPKSLRPFLGRSDFSIVIFVCEKQENGCPVIWPSALRGLSWPFADPVACVGSEEERLERFRFIRDQIESRILDWVAEQSEPSN